MEFCRRPSPHRGAPADCRRLHRPRENSKRGARVRPDGVEADMRVTERSCSWNLVPRRQQRGRHGNKKLCDERMTARSRRTRVVERDAGDVDVTRPCKVCRSFLLCSDHVDGRQRATTDEQDRKPPLRGSDFSCASHLPLILLRQRDPRPSRRSPATISRRRPLEPLEAWWPLGEESLEPLGEVRAGGDPREMLELLVEMVVESVHSRRLVEEPLGDTVGARGAKG